jgi:hypothetical protein
MSTTEQPVAVIIPERDGLPSLSLTVKEFGFVIAALNIAMMEDETKNVIQGFIPLKAVPENTAREWAKVLEAYENVLLVQEVFDSLKTSLIFSNSYDLILNFEPGTRIDFVMKSEWAVLFKTLIDVLKQGGGVSIKRL